MCSQSCEGCRLVNDLASVVDGIYRWIATPSLRPLHQLGPFGSLGYWNEDCRVITVWSGRFVSPTTVATTGIATYFAPNGRVVRVRGTEVFRRI